MSELAATAGSDRSRAPARVGQYGAPCRETGPVETPARARCGRDVQADGPGAQVVLIYRPTTAFSPYDAWSAFGAGSSGPAQGTGHVQISADGSTGTIQLTLPVDPAYTTDGAKSTENIEGSWSC